MLPRERIASGEFVWSGMRQSFFEGFHRSIPAIASAGNHLIIEHIVEELAWMDSLLLLLEPHDVFFVGLHCSLEELERRERERGDRRIGEARSDHAITHTFGEYDLEIDTTGSLEQQADTLLSAWAARGQPSAFTRMAQQRPGSYSA